MRDTKPFLLASALILVCSLSLIGTLVLTGITAFTNQETASATVKENHDPLLPLGKERQDLPLVTFVSQTVRKVSARHDGSHLVISPRTPYPLSCPKSQSLAPVYSLSLTLNKGLYQFTVEGYAAGGGAYVFNEHKKSSTTCGTSVVSWPIQDLGAQARVTRSTFDNKGLSTLSWREGDIVYHLTSERGREGNLYALAGSINKEAHNRLARVCLDLDSTAKDYARNPALAGDKYSPYRASWKVSVPDIAVPERSDARIGSDPYTTTIPGKAPKPIDLAPLAVREDIPVSPSLPPEVERPKKPKAPKKPASEVEILLYEQDVNGPGCGWKFSGSVPPVFDEEAALMKNEGVSAKAKEELLSAKDRYVAKSLRYFVDFDQYAKDVEEFNAYAARYNEQVAAWNKVVAQWDEYFRLLEIYEKEMDAYSSFFSALDSARIGYEEELLECSQHNDMVADKEREEELLGSSEPDEEGSKKPSDQEQRLRDCSKIPVPAIMTEPEPILPVKPEKPSTEAN